MGFEVKTTDPQEMARTLGKRLPSFGIIPARFYDPQYAEYRGNMNSDADSRLDLPRLELVEFTLRKHPSCRIQRAPHNLFGIVAGINLDEKDPFVVICDDNDDNMCLTQPTRISFNDFIGYRVVETYR